jgi:hypothetical protein
MKTVAYAFVAAALAVGVTACDEPSPDSSALEEAGVTVLAEIERDDFTIRFTQSASGTIAVVEEGPLDRPSYLGYFTAEFRATPMEMFLALEPDEGAPEALRVQHAAATEEAPRALSAPNFAFRGVSQSEYAASCVQAHDGAWFDNEWTTRGWTWHWYQNTSAPDTDAPEKTASNFITHLCNYSVTPDSSYNLAHYLYDDGILVGDNTYVNAGNRSVIVVASQAGDYRASAVVAAWASGNYKLGAMAP